MMGNCRVAVRRPMMRQGQVMLPQMLAQRWLRYIAKKYTPFDRYN
jgi:hypothetical protein